MPEFSYRARRRTGEVVQGVVEVADRAAALVQIERQGLFPVAVDAAKGLAASAAAAERSPTRRVDWRALLPLALREALARKRKPKLQELATFTQQLANLLKSGMPLTVALNSMTHLVSKGISADVSKELRQDVMEGRSLSDAMAKQPRIFSDLYINMVRAGESSGALVEVLRRMADHFERRAEFRSSILTSLAYPVLLLLITIAVVVFLVGLGGIYLLGRPVIETRVNKTREQIEEIRLRGNLGGRAQLYADTWRMAREKIWFGWGLGSYGTVFQIYNQQVSVEGWEPFYAQAHSDWLQALAEVGLVGTVLIVLMGIVPLMSLWPLGPPRAVPGYLLAGCGLLALYALVEFPFANPAVMESFWLCFFTALRYHKLTLGDA